MTELSEEAGNALRSALDAEHAAVWVYGLTTAYATESRVHNAINDAIEQHKRVRDTAVKVIRGAGQTAPSAQPAYDVGAQVTDQGSAIELLVKAETDCQTGWRSVLENTDDPGLRSTALDGLTTAATRATRWRLTIGQQPAAQAFPGQA
ncbi:ferritin-like domain-containing protein [Saccharopolyspora oryzae]|uniref:Ferritin-like domain-containing protein n=1 Tax=Saccharopolyspora oryzae TaxID=2997343 RepID=A0ABT4URJ7_9PSEU|nr:ferritin-like domain-containing protein [Saccharopolyspora oryzae]MDA3624343.1 ferritin-like domain-containing protein [Saccharopolyspora oryzae]